MAGASEIQQGKGRERQGKTGHWNQAMRGAGRINGLDEEVVHAIRDQPMRRHKGSAA